MTTSKYLVEEIGLPVDENDSELLLASATGGNVDLIRYLIHEKKLNPTYTEKSSTGMNALCRACLAGKLEVVRFFVETLHYDVNKLWDTDSPATYAIEGDSLPVLKYLIDKKGANLIPSPPYGEHLIIRAARYGRWAIIKYLIEEKHVDPEWDDIVSGTPLHVAVEAGHLDVVKYLVGERKVNVTALHFNKRNVLHRAILRGDSRTGWKKSLDMIKYLIDGANMLSYINDRDSSQKTVAMEAASVGALPVLKYLLDEKRANTTLVDKRGYNLLHIAARENKLPVVKYLIEQKGLDLKAETPQGKTAYGIVSDYSWDTDYAELLAYLKQKMLEKH